MSRRFALAAGLGWCVLTLLACSIGAPSNPPAEVPTAAPATIIPSLESTALPPTKVQVEVPTEMPTDTPTLPPTVTGTSTSTSTPTPTNRPPAATRRSGTVEPLAVRYEYSVRRDANDQAVLTLKVIATGGGGGYAYYNDDRKQVGATFDVPGTCGKPFVHTLKVTSASGQVFSESYFIPGLCPTPTPTPKA